jgi:hypothetical protein
MYRLKSHVNGASLMADHFSRLYLNQGRDCWQMKRRFSVTLGRLARQKKQDNSTIDFDRDWQIGISFANEYFQHRARTTDFTTHIRLPIYSLVHPRVHIIGFCI